MTVLVPYLPVADFLYDMWQFYANNTALRAVLFFALGACLGSFITLLVYRLPRGLPWAATRSRCTACGHALGVLDLVPVLSWVLRGGRCAYCKTPISVRYPLIELACGAIGIALACLF